ncbi:MAG: hypothetical protein Q9M48_00850 [Rhodobacterales bacterium]|nr:hypothetical protein [Rhodobacterales bacterium]
MKLNMKTGVMALGLAVGAVALTIDTAQAQTQAQAARNCGERAAVVQRLADGYGETRQSIGIGANNAVVEVFASAESGTWTITVTAPGGLTCLVASGQAFEALAEALPAKGNDA